ncbi:MAG TPA: hypothetical protein VGD72_05225, partial [Mycobacteriales bacterium]
SAAIVSGTVALIRSRFPRLDAANVVNRLIRTAKDQGAPGRDPLFGFGTVRPYRALVDDVAPVTANPLGQVRVDEGQGSGGLPGAPVPTGVRWDRIGLVGGVLALLLIVALVVGVLVLRSRRRDRDLARQSPAPPPYPHGTPPRQAFGQGAGPPGPP